MSDIAALVERRITDVADFPRPGILFADLSPLFADGPALRRVVDEIIGRHSAAGTLAFNVVAGIEARGFILAGAIAYATGAAMVPIRKLGKLPGTTLAESYTLEYGMATLEVHADAFAPGARVLVVDDVLATGGTVAATMSLLLRAAATVAGVAVVLELTALGGRQRLAPQPITALLSR